MSIDPFEEAIANTGSSDPSLSSEYRYAGFWIRFVASVIDSILIMILILPMMKYFFGTHISTSNSFFNSQGLQSHQFESMTMLSPMGQLVYFLLILVVVMLFWIYRSATPGKMMLGLKIIDAKTGGTITTGQAIGRYFGYYLSCLFFALGFIWAGFDRRKQAWHDKLAGTLVVYSENKKSRD